MREERMKQRRAVVTRPEDLPKEKRCLSLEMRNEDNSRRTF
jgi:hypothetical protein